MSNKEDLQDSSPNKLTGNLLPLGSHPTAQDVAQQLSAIVEGSHDAIISKDLHGTITSWNPAAERLYGYKANEVLGKPVSILIPPDHADDFETLLGRLRRGEWVQEYETVRLTKDGRRLDVSLTISPVRNSQGQIIGASKIARDITERKRSEQALRESEARFRMVADNISQLAWTCDELGVATWFNQRWHDYTGFTPEQMLGLGWKQVVHPDYLERVIQSLKDAQRGGRAWEATVPLRGQDGVYRWFLSRAIPIPDSSGRIIRWFGTNTDVTELRAAQEELQQSKKQLEDELAALARLHGLSTRLLSATDLNEALVDVLDNAMAATGADFGNIQLLKQESAALEIVVQRGFNETFLEHFRSVNVADSSACAQALKAGAAIMIEDVNVDPEFAPHRHIAAVAGFRAVQSLPLRTANGHTVGMLSTHFRKPHTIPDRDRKLLDLYAKHAADLIERVKFQEELEKADRRKDEFLATLAHELRNPLAPIRNGLQLLRHTGTDIEILEKVRAMMERQVQHMVRLVDDLLDVSRISRNTFALQKERLELDSVVKAAVETSRPAIETANHKLIISLPSNPLLLEADPVRLAQAISNLLNNAAKYSEPGGRIWLTADSENDVIVIRVRDTGVGIPHESLPHIFEMFMQAKHTSERAQGGLGIGLTLVQRLISMHGGTVEAASEGLGKGSEFTIRIPALPAAELEAMEKPEQEKAMEPRSRRRVLVADDNQDSVESLAMMLRFLGHEVVTAHDGAEAIELARSFRPEVALLDIGMPKYSGYDVARYMREELGAASVTLVALTGWGQEEDRRRTRDAGFNHHLVKPLDFDLLEKVLEGETKAEKLSAEAYTVAAS